MSLLPVASRVPSGMNAIDVTPPSWQTFDMLHPAAHGHTWLPCLCREMYPGSCERTVACITAATERS